MSAKAKSIIFDLDGTLIHSAPGILSGFEHVFKVNGIEPLIPLVSSIIGPPLIQTLKKLSGINDEKKIRKMAEQFKEYYDLEGCLLSKPYDDVDNGLKKLVENNFELYIATNKRCIPTKNILKHLGWDNLFASVYTVDQAGSAFKSKTEVIKKQIRDFTLSVDQVIYVGDRLEDMEAAQSNKLNFLGVSWGYGEFPSHVRIIKSFNQLNYLASQ